MANNLHAEDINYQQSATFALQNVSMLFPEKQVSGIIGPNGSGKSTLLKVLTNLVSPDKGVVTIDGKEISKMNGKSLARKITMLTQSQSEQLDLSVRELISHGRLPYRKWYEKLSPKDEEIIEWAISITNLTDLQYQSIKQLSGGERQRAWIAMAVVQSPEILLLDEPTTYLDIAHQLEVMELVRYLNANLEMTIIMVLHDINQAAKHSDYLIVVNNGTIVDSGLPRETITEELFRKVFSINAKISEEDGVPSFKPVSLVRDPFTE